MSSSRFEPQTTASPSNSADSSPEGDAAIASSDAPDYEGLVRFLLTPFLDDPDSLRVDCEVSTSRPKVLVRVAFESADKGRVFGRGGRNLHAIENVLGAIARLSGRSLFLDIYGGVEERDERRPPSGSREGRRSRPRRARNSPRPSGSSASG